MPRRGTCPAEGLGCELTPELLNLPCAIVHRYAALAPPGSNKFDEAVSAGNMALLMGSRLFDPSHNIKPTTYLYKCVHREVRRYLRLDPNYRTDRKGNTYRYLYHEDRWHVGSSMDDNPALRSSLVSREPPPHHRLDNQDALEFFKASVPEDEWAAFCLKELDEVTYPELAAAWGVSRTTAANRIKETAEKMAELAGGMR